MASIWPVNLLPSDKDLVTQLQKRRLELGLQHSFAETIRSSVAMALTATDEQLRAGEIDAAE